MTEESKSTGFTGKLASLSLGDSLHDPDSHSTESESEVDSPSYIYITSRLRLDRLTDHIETILSTRDPWQTPHIFLTCHGRDVGFTGGRLGLVGLGIKEDIYLLDVLTYSRCLDVLKGILENESVEKVVWDGRGLGSEFLHGHEISVKKVVDMQLIHVQQKARAERTGFSNKGALKIEDLDTAFGELELNTRNEPGIDLKRMSLIQQEVSRKQSTDKDLWLRRPLKSSLLDHSTYCLLQLRTLYLNSLPLLPSHPHIFTESLRYLELYKEARPPCNAWYLNHAYLPQEIFHRNEETRERFDGAGERVCAGCRRRLHQDSFRESFQRRWTLRLGEHGKLCYTCAAARRSSSAASVSGGSSSNPTSASSSRGGALSPTTMS